MTSTAVHTPSVACTAEQHQLCDLAGFNMHLRQFQAGTCTCDCHPKDAPAGTFDCPGRDLPDDHIVACYRAGHPCPPFVAERTESDTHITTSWRCPCCGSGGSTVCQPKEWGEPQFEVPVELRRGLILNEEVTA